jgi:hypothetical protein
VEGEEGLTESDQQWLEIGSVIRRSQILSSHIPVALQSSQRSHTCTIHA